MARAHAETTAVHTSSFRRGVMLVAGSAIIWSFGGTIARFLTVGDSWTIVFWRALFAANFLLAFMYLRDGARGTIELFRNMGWAGIGVALCFAVASTSFVIALSYTTVANILLLQAGVPLFAALLAWIFFGERTSAATWFAIAAVIAGVAIMVSGSFTGKVSPIGDGLALLIAILFSIATVITRRYNHVRMTPAVCFGAILSTVAASIMATEFIVSLADFAWLFAFGALNLGLGLTFFVTGVRMMPASLAALVGTIEPVLGPLWVWLVHSEVPSGRTILGGSVVFAALFIHLLTDWRRQGKNST